CLAGPSELPARRPAPGAEPVLVGLVGEDDRARQLFEAFADRGVNTRAIVRDPSRPTTMKTRIIAQSQQVVRADWESRADVDGPALKALLATLERELPKCHGLIVSDYGKGVITRAVLEKAIGVAKAKKLPVSVAP